MVTRVRSGVLLSVDDARFLARALAHLDALARKQGSTATEEVRVLRVQLDTAADAYVSDSVTSANDRLPSRHAYIDSTDAARMLGVTPAGVRDLCRRGRIPARRTRAGWLLDAAAVEQRAAGRTD